MGILAKRAKSMHVLEAYCSTVVIESEDGVVVEITLFTPEECKGHSDSYCSSTIQVPSLETSEGWEKYIQLRSDLFFLAEQYSLQIQQWKDAEEEYWINFELSKILREEANSGKFGTF